MMIGKLSRLQRRQLHTFISREIIKPSSQNPSHLQTYNRSPIDQLAQHHYEPLILFYPNNDTCNLTPNEKTTLIKKSLSQTLTQYIPFAGSLPTPTSSYIDCNNEGVVFIEARNDSHMDTFTQISEHDESLDQLFADNMVCDNSPRNTSLVGVQVNHFACGGVGLAVSLSHVIADGCTLGSFVNHWSTVARHGSLDNKEVVSLNPSFIHYTSNTPSSNKQQSEANNLGYGNRVTRKFVFPNSKLNDLKQKVHRSTIPIHNPTRVEVLTSLLYKTAVAASTKKSGCFNPSYLFIPVNIRKRFVPKLPQTTVGNFVSILMIPTKHTSETSLSMLVADIQKEKAKLEGVTNVEKAVEHYKCLESKLGDEDLKNVFERSYWCSSLCGLPFNKVDFGWGKPTGATLALRSANRCGFLLMDTVNGDGIEALAILHKEEMEIFENDEYMLSFCQGYY